MIARRTLSSRTTLVQTLVRAAATAPAVALLVLAIGPRAGQAAVGPSDPAGPTLSDTERSFLINHYKQSREKFLNEIKGLTKAQWEFRPAEDRWTIAEIAEHIVLAEGLGFEIVTKQVMQSPVRTPSEAAAMSEQTIIDGATDRTHKFQAPDVLKPTHRWKAPGEIVDQFEKARAATLAYLQTTTDDLRHHTAMHPVFRKELDGYQWLLTLSSHCERHTNQIADVKADKNFPK